MELNEKVKLILEWLDEKAVTDVEVLDVRKIAVDMDVFVIGTVTNDRLARTAADYLVEKCHENDLPVRGREGRHTSKWLLLDLEDVVVHIFHADERKLYSLEKLWSDAVRVRNAQDLTESE